MLFHKKEIEKADLLGERLVPAARETSAYLVEKLAQGCNIRLRDGSLARQLAIEVLVYYIHWVDRLAFDHLGPDRRDIIRRFVSATAKALLLGPDQELVAGDFGKSLQETYKLRNPQYAHYDLKPEKGGPLKGTLFWEFSKVLLPLFDDDSALGHLSLLVATMTVWTLNDALKVEEVLRD